jgi:hypothetical protein
MMGINSPKHWYVSRCCGRKFSDKSDAYVSDVQIVIQVNRLQTLTETVEKAPVMNYTHFLWVFDPY